LPNDSRPREGHCAPAVDREEDQNWIRHYEPDDGTEEDAVLSELAHQLGTWDGEEAG